MFIVWKNAKGVKLNAVLGFQPVPGPSSAHPFAVVINQGISLTPLSSGHQPLFPELPFPLMSNKSLFKISIRNYFQQYLPLSMHHINILRRSNTFASLLSINATVGNSLYAQLLTLLSLPAACFATFFQRCFKLKFFGLDLVSEKI